MAFNTPAITETDYNPSELAILESLDADTTKSFEGHEFHDRVCLTGHKNSGPTSLKLVGAVFHEEVDFSLTDWSEIWLDGAIFRKGVSFRCVTTSQLYALGVRIYKYADFMDVNTLSADFADAMLPPDTWTRKGDLIHDVIGGHRLQNFARLGSHPAA